MFFKTALTTFFLGVLYVNALSIPLVREPAQYAEFSDLLSREPGKTGPPTVNDKPFTGNAASLLTLFPAAIASSPLGAGTSLVKPPPKSKREILDDLLSREVRDWIKRAESVGNQASKREPSHV